MPKKTKADILLSAANSVSKAFSGAYVSVTVHSASKEDYDSLECSAEEYYKTDFEHRNRMHQSKTKHVGDNITILVMREKDDESTS